MPPTQKPATGWKRVYLQKQALYPHEHAVYLWLRPRSWGADAPGEVDGLPVLTLAGTRRRAYGALIDAIVILPFIVAAILLLVALGVIQATVVGSGLANLSLRGFMECWFAAITMFALVSAIQVARWGATLGKRSLGMAVVRSEGEPISAGFTALRDGAVKGCLFFGPLALLFLLLPLLDYCWIIWDRERRALHDIVVGSRVVRTKDGPIGQRREAFVRRYPL